MEISSIGQRIKQRREELGLTQDELAKQLGYQSRSSINKIELGHQNLTQSKIKAFASALGVTPTFLMGWEEHTSDQFKEAQLKRLLDVYSTLNSEGKAEALKRLEELSELSKYQN